MKTVLNPSDGKTYHIKCGGQVMGGTCIACGQTQSSRISRALRMNEPWLIQTGESKESKKKAHLRRLRRALR